MAKNKRHNGRQVLRKFSKNGAITMTNAVEAATPFSGICDRSYAGNYEIPDSIFKRELEEYENGTLS